MSEENIPSYLSDYVQTFIDERKLTKHTFTTLDAIDFLYGCLEIIGEKIE